MSAFKSVELEGKQKEKRGKETLWGRKAGRHGGGGRGQWVSHSKLAHFLFRPKGLVKPGGPVMPSFLFSVMWSHWGEPKMRLGVSRDSQHVIYYQLLYNPFSCYILGFRFVYWLCAIGCFRASCQDWLRQMWCRLVLMFAASPTLILEQFPHITVFIQACMADDCGRYLWLSSKGVWTVLFSLAPVECPQEMHS